MTTVDDSFNGDIVLHHHEYTSEQEYHSCNNVPPHRPGLVELEHGHLPSLCLLLKDHIMKTEIEEWREYEQNEGASDRANEIPDIANLWR